MCLVLFAFGVIVIRLFRIQVVEHASYLELADRQHTHTTIVDPRRGRIFDRNGYLLAGNKPMVTFEVYWPATPASQRSLVDTLVTRLSGFATASSPVEEFSANQILARNVPLARAMQVIDSGLPLGVNWRVSSARTYTLGDEGAVVLGRWSPDFCEGLEMTMNHLLKGEPGQKTVERSAFPGLQLPVLDGDRQMPRDGTDLMLTIDARFQSVVQEELHRAVELSGAVWGAAVIIDPASGEVLAMGSYPVRSENGCLAMNHCVSGYHEPGSTFKIVTLAACLEEGLVQPSDTFDCSRGQIAVADRIISDCHRFGLLSVADIVAYSSNVGIVRMVSLLDDTLMYHYCRRFGFGTRTGIELPSESEGILRRPEQWSGISLASLAIGQEVAVTPIQLACAFSAVANGGMLMRPRLILASRDEDSWRRWADLPAARAIDASTAALIRDIRALSVETGTGTTAAVPGVSIAGKTGTAERLAQGDDEYLSAFVGMFPADRPELVIAVVIDGPDYEYRFGSALAAPTFASISRQVLSIEPALAMSEETVCPGGMLASASGAGDR